MCRTYLTLEHFNKEAIIKKSSTAAGLVEWVRNIMDYYDVVCEVEPKRQAAKESAMQLQAARIKLEEMNELVVDLNNKLNVLIDK
mmetsp:Transcript_22230/g.10658  ORF Transcript_22230/g.10658 Transcript_22230/m.10658 type:complete len:85 (-) Transcript_22230:3245-3499(-)|eukprot:CAMPEP_0201281828 /NCGR_PEP_ID=MMETSP1317-20130820/4178_1 /ASSEMBLY_ACC=CAM_ASM_000770 /TAXON_ID=187299 /ORGANISM="Undescribed Undescribed, Strain Undescribed" /LENGTH=84 /DNA_ID=CAMNT_0047592843 /DNA_START=3973 /DNA_END=4227 /DNA_ORIENTATION=-